MALLMRHPGDYILIGDTKGKHLSSITGHKHLRRMIQGSSIPDGFIEVRIMHNHIVYSKGGLLKMEYWALPRVARNDN